MVHISGGYEWLPIEQIAAGHKQPEWEAQYGAYFEGHGIAVGPARETKYLRGLLESDPDCLTELGRIAGLD